MNREQPILVEEGGLKEIMGGSFTVMTPEELEKAKNRPKIQESPSNPDLTSAHPF